MDVEFVVQDEREALALLLHEGLTEAVLEFYLAGRVDCGDLLGFHVQDNSICETLLVVTTQDAEFIRADSAED